MPSATGRSRCPPVDENRATAPSQNKVICEAWNGSNTARFGGHGYLYALPQGPLKERATENQTTVPSAPLSGQYVTPPERIGTSITSLPRRGMAPASDRCAMYGAYYKQNQVPGVGSYEPKVPSSPGVA